MTMSPNRYRSRVGLVALALLVVLPAAGSAQQAADDLQQLRFRHIGPVGNRVAAVAGVIGDPHTYYAGAASGGIWKTVDGGLYWEPVFDDHTDHSIGALAVAPPTRRSSGPGPASPTSARTSR